MRAEQQIEGVQGPRLVGGNLRQQIECLSGVGLQFERPGQCQFGLGVISAAKQRQTQVIRNLEGSGLQRIGLFQFQDRRLVLLFRRQQQAEREMYLDVVLVLRGKLRGHLQRIGGAPGLEVSANQVETGGQICRPHAQEVGNGFSRGPLVQEEHTQVVVAVAIRRVEAQNSPEFLLRQVELLLGDVDVSQVVVNLGGAGGKLQCFLEHVDGVRVVLPCAFDNAEKVVSVDAGSPPQQHQDCRPGLIQTPLLNERFNLLEFSGHLGGLLLGRVRQSNREKHKQGEQTAGPRPCHGDRGPRQRRSATAPPSDTIRSTQQGDHCNISRAFAAL